MRKLNRVADQIYNLKYDTEYEEQELKGLQKRGEALFEQVVEKRERMRSEMQRVRLGRMEEVVPCLKLDKIEENTTEVSEKSLRLGQDIP